MEDETKVLSDEEQANDGTSKAPTTQPMLKQILEEMRGSFAEVNQRLTALETTMRKGFDNMDRRLGILSGDIIKLRADVAGHTEKIEDLERKAS